MVFSRLVSSLMPAIVLLVLTMFASSCRVSTDELFSADSATVGGLPAVGPLPQSSHWHAAYVVRVCDDVLDPFDSDADPLGIHSHADGIIHVHPFFEEAGYENATLGLFADAMGFTLGDGELTLPGGGTWRDGDLCNDLPGRVFVDRWSGPTSDASIERIFTDLADIRFLADAELYQIGFAPADSPPVVPPSSALLGQLSNLSLPPDPWIDVDAAATQAQASFWKVSEVGPRPCQGAQVPERVLSGVSSCFTPADEGIAAADAIASARAVLLNRRPAIELQTSAPLIELINGHFARNNSPLVLAIEVDGWVITAPQLVRPPVGQRLVISGGLSTETATALAAILNGDA